MQIRLATVEDVEVILALQRLAYQSEAAIYDDFTIPPLTETLDDLKARFGDRRFLKAIEDAHIVGSVRAFRDGVTCHVERLIVHPDYRRRGIGTALLNEIETVFPDARRCELFTGYRSAGNIRLYQRLGYQEFRREQVNEKVTLVYMEKAKGAAMPISARFVHTSVVAHDWQQCGGRPRRDPKLTASVYTHLEVYDQAAAIQSLPVPPEPQKAWEADALRATGTDSETSELRTYDANSFPHASTARALRGTKGHKLPPKRAL